MFALLVPLFLMVALVSVAFAADKEFKSNSTVIKVLGNSGKFTVKPPKGSGAMVTFDYLYELDSTGAEIGNSGNTKHSIQTFASQSFTFGNPTPTVYQNVSTTQLDFETKISSTVGTLKISTYIFGENGNVGTQTESWAVKKGDVKFNIELSGWTWCAGNNCKQGNTPKTGAYIDVAIEIKGKNSAEKKKGGNSTYDLGDKVNLELSNQVLVDGAWQSMPSGYPKVTTKGGKTLFVFRFPKFSNKAVYDPILGLSESEDSPSQETSGAGKMFSSSLASLLVITSLFYQQFAW